jgi:predicted RNA-binding protein with PIN domain
MALLIDGYNLLHVTGIFGRGGSGTALHQSREALLDYLAVAIDERQRAQTTIVFDASGAPPGLPRTLFHQDMTVHFARGYPDADEMIEQIIEGHQQPQMLLVVSSDHRVQRAARRRRAKLIDSDRWFAELQAARRDAAATPTPPTKPPGRLSAEQVDYWLKKFNQPRSDSQPPREAPDDAADPFPPGYGEDVLGEQEAE